MAKRILTPRLVDTLSPPPGKQREIFFDQHQDAPQGFALRVTSTGARSFYLLQTLKATRRRLWVHLGNARTIGLDAARAAARAKAGDIARDRDPNLEAKASRAALREAQRREKQDRAAPTVAGLVERYIEARARRLSPVTHHSYRRLLAKEIAPKQLGSVRADSLVRADVRDFLAAKAKAAPYVADHILALLRSSYRWGQVEESAPGVPLVSRDPTVGLEGYSPRKRRTRYLSDQEVPRFWDGVESLGVVKACFARLLLLLGLRRGEAFRATWADVDLEAAVWRVPSERRKLRATIKAVTPDLEVPLPPLAVSLLTELRVASKGRDRLFRFSIGMIGDEIKAATKLSLSVHDLRRSMASGLERLGAPPHVISLALGHSPSRSMATASDLHYVLSKRPEELRLWLERWARHVGALAGDTTGAGEVLPLRRA